MQLSDLLNKLITIDNDINTLNKTVKKKREEKAELSNVIMKYMKQKDMDKLNDKHNNCFCIKQNKTYGTISQTLLKNTLYECCSEKKEADNLLKHVLNNRKETIDDTLIIKPHKLK